MLLAHGDPDSGFEEVFAGARIHGPLVSIELDDHALDEFMLAFEQTANFAQNIEAMERLGQAFARIDAGFAGMVDPGWHMLRPAFSGLDISPKQG
ncbi:MAG: hypothetical protein ACREH9_13065 [Pseudomonadota bacterium]